MSAKVSVIMPCLNSAQHIQGAVQSVLDQSFTDYELIVVDNGSTDGTSAVLDHFTDPRIRRLVCERRGVGFARNQGLRCSSASYVAFLDSDDSWDPAFLEKMVLALDARPDAVMAYCGWQNIGLAPPRNAPYIPPDYEVPQKIEILLEGCKWPIHGALSLRSAITNSGSFNTELKIAEDYLLWMHVANSGKIVRVPEVLAYYRHHDGHQATHDKVRAALDTLQAKKCFLSSHPDIAKDIGKNKIADLTWKILIRQGELLQWSGDLAGARLIYRKVLCEAPCAFFKKWSMLPSLLPIWAHNTLLSIKRVI